MAPGVNRSFDCDFSSSLFLCPCRDHGLMLVFGSGAFNVGKAGALLFPSSDECGRRLLQMLRCRTTPALASDARHGPQVKLFISDGAPKAFDEDVVTLDV